MKKSRWKLSTEISALTILSSVGAILFLGVALIMMFMFFFSRRSEENMEYYLQNSLQQFDDKIQYIKDGAISIRHNIIMDDFFNKNHYDEKEVETQLTYCMDLFSERNLVDQNTPFAVTVYLFNNKGAFVRSNYYPGTLAAAGNTDIQYRNLHQIFESTHQQYACFTRQNQTDLCFQVFDESMKKVGCCIVSIQNKAIAELFASIEAYKNGCWLVSGNDGAQIVGAGNENQASALGQLMPNTTGSERINGRRSLYHTMSSGFGIRAAVAVDRINIYSVLGPTIASFVLVLVFVLAAASIVILGVSYKLTRPLKKMADEIGLFGQENLTMRMQDFSVQEFHDISVVFNEMADRIDYLVTQIYEKELLATRAQVKYLQAQINPHFQFNILSMLSIKARMAGNEELYQGLHAFSKLIQGKIFREKEIKIPLSEELELVKFYLYLQTSRFRDKISYEINVEERTKNFQIPRLLVEPLVENAVSHGLEPKIGNGHIQIDVFEQEARLHIVIQDDGVGFDPAECSRDPIQAAKPGHTLTGLTNTKRLLNVLYGKNHDMVIEGTLGKGARIEMILPIERGADHVESAGC